MNIDEAIEVLREDLGADTYDSHPYLYQAQKLGIEALKRIKEYREYIYTPPLQLLPGEQSQSGGKVE